MILNHIGDAEYFQGRVLLATTNKIVDEVNYEMVERSQEICTPSTALIQLEILIMLPCSQLNFSAH